jgi:hypothetical protein
LLTELGVLGATLNRVDAARPTAFNILKVLILVPELKNERLVVPDKFDVQTAEDGQSEGSGFKAKMASSTTTKHP